MTRRRLTIVVLFTVFLGCSKRPLEVAPHGSPPPDTVPQGPSSALPLCDTSKDPDGSGAVIVPVPMTMAVVRVQVSPENAHSQNTNPCGPYHALAGLVVDYGDTRYEGFQAMCQQTKYFPLNTVATDPVLTDLKVDPEGKSKVGGNACDPGYEDLGTVADCGVWPCNGNQRLCAKFEPANIAIPAKREIQMLHITPSGAHLRREGTPAVRCPEGFTDVGGFADCGGGTCDGTQFICVAKRP